MKVISRFLMDPAMVRAQLKEDEKAWPSPIPFIPTKSLVKKRSSKKSDDTDGAEDIEGDYITFDIKLAGVTVTAGAEPESYKKKVYTFENGTPEDWVTWRIATDQFFQAKGCLEDTTDNSKARHVLYGALFKGEAKDKYIKAWNARNKQNNEATPSDRWSEVELQRVVINDMAKSFFLEWPKAYQSQKYYMRNNLYLGDLKPDNFFKRVRKMNEYFKYFPVVGDDDAQPTELDEDEIICIVTGRNVKKPQWHIELMVQGKRPDDFATLDAVQECYNYMYRVEQIRGNQLKRMGIDDAPSKTSSKERPKRKRDFGQREQLQECKTCGKRHKGKCWEKAENAHLCPNFTKKHRSSAIKEELFTLEQMNALVKQKMARKANNRKSKKRTIRYDESDKNDNMMANLNISDGSDNNTSDEDSDYFSCYTFSERNRLKKKTKTGHFTAEIIVEIEDRDGNLVPIRCLLDTGTTSTLVLRDFVRKGGAKIYKGKCTTWSTLGGQFSTNRKALIDFKFPELHSGKKVS